jgi:aspartate/methionine/tyrosine aminotransferase
MLSPRFRPELAAVRESPLVVIATEAERTPGSIKLCYGESDMPTAEFICRAAYDASLAGHTFYTHTAGSWDLREAIAAKIDALHGVRYAPSSIMATVGGSMAIYVAIRAFVGSGDNAVIISPAYAIYATSVTMAGGEPRLVPLARAASGFVLDIERIRAAIDGNTRMLIVNSPANPTGWRITPDEQRALYEIASRHDVMLLADEVYERLVFDDVIAPSFARIAPSDDRLIVVNSFSKTYNMTGWRLGWAQASERTIRVMYSAAEFMTSNPTAMVQQAGIVALRDGEASVRATREHLAARRGQVRAALADLPGLTLPEPRGAFYAFPRLDGVADSAALATALLRSTGVALAPGSAFGPGGESHLRLCFAASEATLGQALERIRSRILELIGRH